MHEIQVSKSAHRIICAELGRRKIRHRVGAAIDADWRVLEIAYRRHLPLVRFVVCQVMREIRRIQTVEQYQRRARSSTYIAGAVA